MEKESLTLLKKSLKRETFLLLSLTFPFHLLLFYFEISYERSPMEVLSFFKYFAMFYSYMNYTTIRQYTPVIQIFVFNIFTSKIMLKLYTGHHSLKTLLIFVDVDATHEMI